MWDSLKSNSAVITMEISMLLLLLVSSSVTFKSVVLFIELLSVICDVIDYYCVAWKCIGIWLISLNKQKLFAFLSCCCFVLMSSTGLRLPVVMLFIVAKMCYLKGTVDVIGYHRVLYVVFGGGGDDNSFMGRQPCLLTKNRSNDRSGGSGTVRKLCGSDI